MTLPPDQLQALRILAGTPDGCTETLLAACGISVETMVALVNAGYATARSERVRAGDRWIEAATLTITNAGQRAITA